MILAGMDTSLAQFHYQQYIKPQLKWHKHFSTRGNKNTVYKNKFLLLRPHSGLRSFNILTTLSTAIYFFFTEVYIICSPFLFDMIYRNHFLLNPPPPFSLLRLGLCSHHLSLWAANQSYLPLFCYSDWYQAESWLGHRRHWEDSIRHHWVCARYLKKQQVNGVFIQQTLDIRLS